jgi:hypothetical protein
VQNNFIVRRMHLNDTKILRVFLEDGFVKQQRRLATLQRRMNVQRRAVASFPSLHSRKKNPCVDVRSSAQTVTQEGKRRGPKLMEGQMFVMLLYIHWQVPLSESHSPSQTLHFSGRPCSVLPDAYTVVVCLLFISATKIFSSIIFMK